MINEALLKKVKSALGITGDFQNETLTEYILEVLDFLRDAGVKEVVLQSDSISGIVTRGVSDLWNYGSKGGELSPYFMQRATQLSYKLSDKENHDLCHVTDDEIHQLTGEGG